MANILVFAANTVYLGSSKLVYWTNIWIFGANTGVFGGNTVVLGDKYDGNWG